MTRLAMRPRFLASIGVAVGLLTTAAPCLAASALDPDGIYESALGRRAAGPTSSGASSVGGGFSFFRFGSSIPRTVVAYSAKHAPGTIFISTRERRLYYVLGNGQAIQYGIGVGRDGFTWSGVKTVSAKREWPDWTPPAQMLKRRPDLPRFMRGGGDNPLGARAIYLGSSLYRIHGSNEPETIGTATSSGCFRLTNEDVIDLYNRVRVGSTVIVQH
jgi:lipoprotein-anchoring transpeptidase ErfK/SrfK